MSEFRHIVLDPGDHADLEVEFGRLLAPYQEPDGAWACDDHIILDLALRALDTVMDRKRNRAYRVA